MVDSSDGTGIDLPKTFRGSALQEFAAGRRNQCQGGFRFDVLFKGSGEDAEVTRIFGAGVGRDRLQVVGTDPANDAAVFWTRTPNYSASFLVQARDDGFIGSLLEAPAKGLSRGDARSLLEAAADPADLRRYLKRETKGRGRCAWASEISLDQPSERAFEYWAGVVPAQPAGPSVPPTTIELDQAGGDDRFMVEIDYLDFSAAAQEQSAITPGDEGMFWFSAPDDVEMVIKILDRRASNGHFWVFYGSLTNVAFEMTVTDTQTGDVAAYSSEGGLGGAIVIDRRALPDGSDAP